MRGIETIARNCVGFAQTKLVFHAQQAEALGGRRGAGQ